MQVKKNSLAILIAISLAVASTSGQEVQKIYKKIDIQQNGTAYISLLCIRPNTELNDMLLPLQDAQPTDFLLNGVRNSEISVKDSNHATYIYCPSSAIGVLDSFTITYTLSGYMNISAKTTEFGHISIKEKFINTSGMLIKQLITDIILPAGYAVNSIDESIPKVNGNNPEIPYAVTSTGQRHTVRLLAKELKLGDASMVAITAKKDEKSILFLLILIAAIVIYAVFYRDILKPIEKKE